MEVCVRFAPSPTGILHVGGIRTALFNFFFAKSKNGTFILRNEDTDQARIVEGAIEATKESLTWLGVTWDDLVTQSARLEEYKKYAWELILSGKAKEETGAIRFIVPKDGRTLWTDAIGDKEISFENRDVEDFIILKRDGFPTYHLANVVDDHLMKISHVIRGEDWIPSTPKHIMLYNAFGWNHPVFAHVPNVLGTDGKKLSKRKGAKSVLDFKKEGILADALLNYLMLLGWSPKDDREILNRDEIAREFSLKNIQSSPAVFDEKKLLWMNGEYIRQFQISNLKLKILEFDPEISSIKNFEQYLPLAQTRMKTLADFKDLAVNDSNYNYSPGEKTLAGKLTESLNSIPEWNKDTILKTIFDFRDTHNQSMKNMYILLTGKPQGLPIAEKLEIDGKEETISWLRTITS